MSPAIAEKAAKYLLDGRLRVTAMSGDTIRARCKGRDAVYTLGWTAARGWHCDCPARVYVCCHIAALKLVTRPAQ